MVGCCFAANGETTSPPDFVAEGAVIWEQFRPLDTNYLLHGDGHFFFIYTNGVWDIQIAYGHYLHPTLRIPDPAEGTLLDCKRIPDGIRQIALFRGDTNHPYAVAQRGSFPAFLQRELFLPWLTLCPDPQLPMVNSNLIRFDFSAEFENEPGNQGRFDRVNLAPDDFFISKLDVENNGTFFMSGLGPQQYPGAYKDGFREFSYRVTATTNVGGIEFPTSSLLISYAPAPGGRSREDLYASVVVRLAVESISLSGQASNFVSMPNHLIAADSRPPGLKTQAPASYEVIDDTWAPVTNSRLERLAAMMRNAHTNDDALSGHRRIVLYILLCVTVIPVAVYWINRSNNKHKKQKEI
jgi:hypothetical protein